MGVSIKFLVKSIFKIIKSCKFFARKIDASSRNTMESETHYNPPIYVFNKFGVIEHISDQCDNNTCTCKDRCQVDDMVFYESVLLDVYKRKMCESQEKEGKDNG